MKLRKYSHACVRLEKAAGVLVIDPGVFSESAEALEGAHAILITHEHPDHVDQGAVVAALTADPGLQLHAPAGVAQTLRQAAPELAARLHAVAPQDSFTAAGFAITAVGGVHATIHPSMAPVTNVGYIVDGTLYHPGDALFVPPGVRLETLLVPLHAPWSKIAEVVDFIVAVRAPRVHQIHDALLTPAGLSVTEPHLSRIGALHGVTFTHLDVRESVEL